jgi:hypothetical protein
MATITLLSTFVTESCIACGCEFAMNSGTYRRFRDNHQSFYCPYGHEQYYSGKSDSEKLAEAIKEKEHIQNELKYSVQSRDFYKEQNENHKNALRATRGVVTKMKKRSIGGTCQCCNRYFKNVHDHYKSKHPDYSAE